MAFNEHVPAIEQKIITGLIERALAKDLTVSVSDGEEWPVKTSTDLEEITAGIGHTDMTTLRFRTKPDKTSVGCVWLVHGNEDDVISDHTDNELMEELCRL